jgi:hypothetical protein
MLLDIFVGPKHHIAAITIFVSPSQLFTPEPDERAWKRWLQCRAELVPLLEAYVHDGLQAWEAGPNGPKIDAINEEVSLLSDAIHHTVEKYQFKINLGEFQEHVAGLIKGSRVLREEFSSHVAARRRAEGSQVKSPWSRALHHAHQSYTRPRAQVEADIQSRQRGEVQPLEEELHIDTSSPAAETPDHPPRRSRATFIDTPPPEAANDAPVPAARQLPSRPGKQTNRGKPRKRHHTRLGEVLKKLRQRTTKE